MKVASDGRQRRTIAEVEGNLAQSVTATFDDLDWWVKATMAARAEKVAEAA